VLTIFALASGRSGTHFLYELLRRNTLGCICRHETYSFSNPSMFGRPIHDYAVGDLAAVRRQVQLKARWIGRQRAEAYAETSHALLKSWFEVAPEFFPNLRLVHLVRNVLHVAKSEANREELIHRWRVPLRYARGSDGSRFFRWALTGIEPIFGHFAGMELTRFQWYVVQWIEIENRAMRMLDRFALHNRCLTLHSPQDLNDACRIEQLLDFLEVIRRRGPLAIAGGKNRTPGRQTVVTADDEQQARAVIACLPPEKLEIFRQPPYAEIPWSGILRGSPIIGGG
jgi:hypothetical protein